MNETERRNLTSTSKKNGNAKERRVRQPPENGQLGQQTVSGVPHRAVWVISVKRRAGGAPEQKGNDEVSKRVFMLGRIERKKSARAKLFTTSGDLSGFRGHGGLTRG